MDFYSLMDKLKGQAPGTTKAVRQLNNPGKPVPPAQKPLPNMGLLTTAAQTVGFNLSAALAQTMGTPGQSRMSMFGSEPFGGRRTTAPVYKTPLNNVTDADVKADKELRKVEEGYVNPDPKRQQDAGLNTGTGTVESRPQQEVTTYDTFQEQQAALMDSIAGRYSDPRTAALIRGVPQNPFSSTQLPYTSDNFFTNAEDFDLGIDTSGMLERSKDIDYEKLAESVTEGSQTFQTFPLEAGNFIEDYESPVNFNAPKNPVEPMLNPNVDGMTAMRMKDRDLGLMYASGQFFAEGSDGSPVLVNRDLAKSVRRGDEGAKDQLAAYLAGGGIKPQGGVISNPPKEDMVPTKTESPAAGTESLVDPSFNSDDYEVMGGDPANSAVMQQGGGVQMDIDSNFDFNSPKTTQFSALDHPFSKVLAENPENRPEKMQVVDTDKFGSVTSLINKYGIDDYLKRMNAGQFF
jgi:hypothetical protein